MGDQLSEVTGAVWAGGDVRQYISGMDISLVMCVGVWWGEGNAWSQRFLGGEALLGSRRRMEVERWAETSVFGQVHLRKDAQACWHEKDGSWQSLAKIETHSPVCGLGQRSCGENLREYGQRVENNANTAVYKQAEGWHAPMLVPVASFLPPFKAWEGVYAHTCV